MAKLSLLLFLAAVAIIRGKAEAPPSDSKTPAPPPASPQPAKQEGSVDSVLAQLRSGLTKQVQGALEENGSSITIMVVGETGVGKTSLLSNLFHRGLEWPVGSRTPKIQEQTVTFHLDGGGKGEGSVPFEAHLIDSPGWGDLMSLTRSFKLVTKHIDHRFRRELRAESRLYRAVRSPALDNSGCSHVDVVLYTFNPHRCKGIDMAFLRRLTKQVSIVPVLTKADTMTVTELNRFRREVTEALRKADIHVAHPPLAVICSEKEQGPKAKRGRTYPWGVALSEDESHSELPKLRRFLLTEGLLALKQRSLYNYERFRRRTLRRQRFNRCVALALSVVALDARPRAWLLAHAARWLQSAALRLPVVPSLKVSWKRRELPSPPPSPPPKPGKFAVPSLGKARK